MSVHSQHANRQLDSKLINKPGNQQEPKSSFSSRHLANKSKTDLLNENIKKELRNIQLKLTEKEQKQK